MARMIEWQYRGTPQSPNMIQIGDQCVPKGGRFMLPEDYDWKKKHGLDIRKPFDIVRITPPDPVTPAS